MSLPLVLVPGTLCDERVFKRITPKLRQEAPIVHLSLRRLSSRQSWVLGLLRALPERFAIAGFSLGGLVALEMLRRAPERIAGLALISSNAEPAGSRHKSTRRHLTDKLRFSGPQRLCGSLKQRYFLSTREAFRSRAELLRMARRTSPHHARNQFAFAACRQSGHQSLRLFSHPLLILSGHHDPICPPALQMRAAQSSSRSVLRMLPRCGHFSPWEHPGQVSNALLNWIKEANAENRECTHASN
jgi:pimeloyl-ACP methyl ester carboxylesterase